MERCYLIAKSVCVCVAVCVWHVCGTVPYVYIQGCNRRMVELGSGRI